MVLMLLLVLLVLMVLMVLLLLLLVCRMWMCLGRGRRGRVMIIVRVSALRRRIGWRRVVITRLHHWRWVRRIMLLLLLLLLCMLWRRIMLLVWCRGGTGGRAPAGRGWGCSVDRSVCVRAVWWWYRSRLRIRMRCVCRGIVVRRRRSGCRWRERGSMARVSVHLVIVRRSLLLRCESLVV